MSKKILFGRFRTLDIGSSLVIITTFVLFAVSLLLKGLTHEILLETGVFLVSVKIIILSHEGNMMKKSMEAKLNDIHEAVVKRNECNADSVQLESLEGSSGKELRKS